jgi:uncharacterized protein
VIIPDANLLIYAYDATSARHERAKAWWESCLNGDEPVGIPWIVVLAFTRLMTHPTLSENPMTIPDVRRIITDWLECCQARLLTSGEQTLAAFFNLLEPTQRGGNLTTDALIAASALEYGGTVYSTDRDFDLFPAIRWVDPLRG